TRAAECEHVTARLEDAQALRSPQRAPLLERAHLDGPRVRKHAAVLAEADRDLRGAVPTTAARALAHEALRVGRPGEAREALGGTDAASVEARIGVDIRLLPRGVPALTHELEAIRRIGHHGID